MITITSHESNGIGLEIIGMTSDFIFLFSEKVSTNLPNAFIHEHYHLIDL